MTADGTGAPHVGEDAQRLLAAVQDWARRTLPPPESDASTCEWCPVCSFVAVLRGDRPDLTERVAEAGAAVVTAVRALFEPPPTDQGDETP